ncbi:hypothetical protein CCP3SC5AM1_1300003 [Gammaproteobacteria bacterium]
MVMFFNTLLKNNMNTMLIPGRRAAFFLLVVTVVNSSVALARGISARSSQVQAQAEASISTNSPYVQQTLIYTVRVVTRTNVLEFSLNPPTVPGAALELLEDKPRTYARPTADGQMVVNEYRYALTPLVAGRIDVPPTNLSGKAESLSRGTVRRDVSFDARTKRVSLQSRLVPPSATQPWLPVQALALISEGEIQQAQIGEPFTLSLWLRAVGVRGQRLPTLADLLQGPDFRVYPEKAVEYWQDVTPDGDAVRGQRHEILTIVPLKAGTLQLPAVRIAWWDTIKDKPATLEWQLPPIVVTDPTSISPWGILGWLLTLPAAAIFFFLGWWLGRAQPGIAGIAGVPRRILGGWQQIGERLRSLSVGLVRGIKRGYQPVRVRCVAFLNKQIAGRIPFAIRRLRLDPFFARLLPTVFHTRRLFRHVQAATNAEAISDALQIYATTALTLPRHIPLTVVAETMIINHPEFDASALSDLLHQLDAALYGSTPVAENNRKLFDIERWKQDFREVIRPMRHQPRRAPLIDPKGLPPLNPDPEIFDSHEKNEKK